MSYSSVSVKETDYVVSFQQMVNPCYILVSNEIIINKKKLHIDLYLMRFCGEDTNINWKWNEAQYLGFRQQTISSTANTAQCFVK